MEDVLENRRGDESSSSVDGGAQASQQSPQAMDVSDEVAAPKAGTDTDGGDTHNSDGGDESAHAATADDSAGADADEQSDARVKVYKYAGEKGWEDLGTGHISVQTPGDDMIISVHSEDNGTLLTVASVKTCSGFHRQQRTLVVWHDPEQNQMAVSFQTETGCTTIWHRLCQVAGMDPESSGTCLNTSDDDVGGDLAGMEHLLQLPDAQLGSLSEVADVVAAIAGTRMEAMMREQEFREISAAQCDHLAEQMLAKNYLASLVETFNISEDLESTEHLHFLYDIVKNLFMTCHNTILELLFEPKNILDVVGMLEYPPEEPHVAHREFLTTKAVFKEVIPLRDPDLLEQIHQTYRIQYIKDVVLARVMDDMLLSRLKDLLLFNSAEIVEKILHNEGFMRELHGKLEDPSTPLELRRDLICLLHELCKMSRDLQAEMRPRFFEALADHGVFRAFATNLTSDDLVVRSNTVAILSAMLRFNIVFVRDAIMPSKPQTNGDPAGNEDDEQPAVLSLITQCFVSDTNPGMVSALAEVLRLLLDTEHIDVAKSASKTEFLSMFYEDCMPVLVSPVDLATPRYTDIPCNRERLVHVLDTVAFCVPIHSYHIKNYLLRGGLLTKAAALVKSPDTVIATTAVRLLRTIVVQKNQFFNRHLAKAGLLKPVMEVFAGNGSRYNLLNSIVLDLLELIRKENIKVLVAYIVENHKAALKSVDYVSTGELLNLKYLQNKDQENGTSSASAEEDPAEAAKQVARRNRLKRDTSMDREEEDYFDAEDDDGTEEERVPTPTLAGPQSPWPLARQDSLELAAQRAATAAEGVSPPAPLPSFRRRSALVDYDDDEDDDLAEVFKAHVKKAKFG
eukprot:m.8941 g.8941  ORF g.8941 m.8941 type:complete len:852 (-) comp3370_c0_seq1:42-2597(-)